MAKTKQSLPNDNEEVQQVAVIERQVLRDLGHPADLQKVQVRHLWGHSYRVNILAGLDFVSAKVAHSYFITIDERGGILSSTPPVVRTYSVMEAASGVGRM